MTVIESDMFICSKNDQSNEAAEFTISKLKFEI